MKPWPESRARGHAIIEPRHAPALSQGHEPGCDPYNSGAPYIDRRRALQFRAATDAMLYIITSKRNIRQ